MNDGRDIGIMSGVNALNRLFTQYIFRDLLQNRENPIYFNVANKYVKNTGSKKNREIIHEVYSHMSKNYRNEYFYQNTLLNKLLLGRHSINTTTALTQIPINNSKADFILINGKAVVYEIKTELDSFERLENQINDYFNAFNHVCVVTCEKNYNKLMQLLLNEAVGICILTDHNTLDFRREAKEYNEKLNRKALFKILHKSEFENILQSYFGALPQTKPVFYYNECYNHFQNIPILDAYELVLKELKKRNKIIKENFKNVPYELKSLMYFYSKYDNNYVPLNNFLQREFGR